MSLKVLLLLPYFDRPNMVRNPLNTIKNLTYPNWELAFIDDGSIIHGRPVVEEVLADYLDRTRFYRLEDSVEQKLKQGGSKFGGEMNQAMLDSDADLVVTICDDDGIVEDSLEHLTDFYEKNPEVMYAYSHVKTYDPTKETAGPHVKGTQNWYNRSTADIEPVCQMDCSQMSFRMRCFTKGIVKWPSPKTACLDADMLGQLREKYGLCKFSGYFLQYKGVYPGQMGNRKGDEFLVPTDEYCGR